MSNTLINSPNPCMNLGIYPPEVTMPFVNANIPSKIYQPTNSSALTPPCASSCTISPSIGLPVSFTPLPLASPVIPLKSSYIPHHSSNLSNNLQLSKNTTVVENNKTENKNNNNNNNSNNLIISMSAPAKISAGTLTEADEAAAASALLGIASKSNPSSFLQQTSQPKYQALGGTSGASSGIFNSLMSPPLSAVPSFTSMPFAAPAMYAPPHTPISFTASLTPTSSCSSLTMPSPIPLATPIVANAHLLHLNAIPQTMLVHFSPSLSRMGNINNSRNNTNFSIDSLNSSDETGSSGSVTGGNEWKEHERTSSSRSHGQATIGRSKCSNASLGNTLGCSTKQSRPAAHSDALHGQHGSMAQVPSCRNQASTYFEEHPNSDSDNRDSESGSIHHYENHNENELAHERDSAADEENFDENDGGSSHGASISVTSRSLTIGSSEGSLSASSSNNCSLPVDENSSESDYQDQLDDEYEGSDVNEGMSKNYDDNDDDGDEDYEEDDDDDDIRTLQRNRLQSKSLKSRRSKSAANKRSSIDSNNDDDGKEESGFRAGSIYMQRPSSNLSASSEERLQCPKCQSTFTKKSHVLRHVRSVHEKNTSSTCPACGKCYTFRHHMIRHYRSAHNGERVRCLDNDCSKTFSQRGHMMAHYNFVHLGKRVPCPHCKSTFSDSSHMRYHVKTMHMNERVPDISCLTSSAH